MIYLETPPAIVRESGKRSFTALCQRLLGVFLLKGTDMHTTFFDLYLLVKKESEDEEGTAEHHFLSSDGDQPIMAIFTSPRAAHDFIEENGLDDECDFTQSPLLAVVETILAKAFYKSPEFDEPSALFVINPDGPTFAAMSVSQAMAALLVEAHNQGHRREDLSLGEAQDVAERHYEAVFADAEANGVDFDKVVSALAMIHRRSGYTPN